MNRLKKMYLDFFTANKGTPFDEYERKHFFEKWVAKYAEEIRTGSCSLANGLYHAEYIMNLYKDEIWERLERLGIAKDAEGKYKLHDLEWDYYDQSIELMDCEEGFTLTSAQRDAINDMGFRIIFVNYKNGPHLYGNHTAAMDAMPEIKDD